MQHKSLFILIVLLQLTFFSCSQKEDENVLPRTERAFDESEIDKLNTSDRFDYDKEIEVADNPVLDFFLDIFSGIVKFFSYSFSYILIGGILLLVVWIIIKKSRPIGFKVNKDEPNLRVISEDNIENADYKPLLELALGEKDYRLAIRFSFIISLQNLQKAGQIKWHKEKTNYQYLSELPTELQAPFQKLTRIYEYVWYGEAEASSQLYSNIQAYSENLKVKKL